MSNSKVQKETFSSAPLDGSLSARGISDAPDAHGPETPKWVHDLWGFLDRLKRRPAPVTVSHAERLSGLAILFVMHLVAMWQVFKKTVPSPSQDGGYTPALSRAKSVYALALVPLQVLVDVGVYLLIVHAVYLILYLLMMIRLASEDARKSSLLDLLPLRGQVLRGIVPALTAAIVTTAVAYVYAAYVRRLPTSDHDATSYTERARDVDVIVVLATYATILLLSFAFAGRVVAI